MLRPTASDQTTKTATFNLGNDSRSITFTNEFNTQNNPHFEFEYSGDNSALQTALAQSLTFHADGNCMDGEADNYIVKFGVRDGWTKTFTCNNGDYSLVFNNDNVPTEGLNIWIENANQPGPSQGYELEFANISSVDENGEYVLVTSYDQSLAGKTFRLTPSTGQVGCMGRPRRRALHDAV